MAQFCSDSLFPKWHWWHVMVFVNCVRCTCNKKLRFSYRRGTARRSMLVSSCYVSRRMAVRKVSISKSDLQGHSTALAMVPFDKPHIFSICVPLQLCLPLAPLIHSSCYIHGPWRAKKNFCCFICVSYGPYTLLQNDSFLHLYLQFFY